MSCCLCMHFYYHPYWFYSCTQITSLLVYKDPEVTGTWYCSLWINSCFALFLSHLRGREQQFSGGQEAIVKQVPWSRTIAGELLVQLRSPTQRQRRTLWHFCQYFSNTFSFTLLYKHKHSFPESFLWQPIFWLLVIILHVDKPYCEILKCSTEGETF